MANKGKGMKIQTSQLPESGVTYVIRRAAELGFSYKSPEWANLGQGAPETGKLPGGIKRVSKIELGNKDHSYSPCGGLTKLREQVADYYNQVYRRGKKSLYKPENVSICGGGRLGLARVLAGLSDKKFVGVVPDYPGYQGLLKSLNRFGKWWRGWGQEAFEWNESQWRTRLEKAGAEVLLLSNPNNPTGKVIQEAKLAGLVQAVRKCGCVLVMDEFYAHYVYSKEKGNEDKPVMVSAAEVVEEVDEEPVVLINGLTKGWRYPGWRVGWVVGPRKIAERATRAGSYLDGGPSRPLQQAALKLVKPESAIQEAGAIENRYRKKRDWMVDKLRGMGIKVEEVPEGAFYVWADLSQLPERVNDGQKFFEAGLKEKVITVPGKFFDPDWEGKPEGESVFKHYCRISFGPEMAVLKRGVEGMKRVISNH
jgi:aspartate/methionine/tyrosine aminotransferase